LIRDKTVEKAALYIERNFISVPQSLFLAQYKRVNGVYADGRS